MWWSVYLIIILSLNFCIFFLFYILFFFFFLYMYHNFVSHFYYSMLWIASHWLLILLHPFPPPHPLHFSLILILPLPLILHFSLSCLPYHITGCLSFCCSCHKNIVTAWHCTKSSERCWSPFCTINKCLIHHWFLWSAHINRKKKIKLDYITETIMKK